MEQHRCSDATSQEGAAWGQDLLVRLQQNLLSAIFRQPLTCQILAPFVCYRVDVFDLLFLCKTAFHKGDRGKRLSLVVRQKSNLRAHTVLVLRSARRARSGHGCIHAGAGVTGNENTKLNGAAQFALND